MLPGLRLSPAALLLAACSDPTGPGPAEAPARPELPAGPRAGQLAEPPSIVLVSVDTLRREHLGCYGYFRETSPRIDEFARESVLFEQAFASMASTLPSHLTMLTGLYPHQHGMTSNLRGAHIPYKSELGRLSVAAVLRECGYVTAGFASAVPLARQTGIDAGFDTFSAPQKSAQGSYQSAEETTAQVLSWLEGEPAREQPLFLFVHYFDPHEPNEPPRQLARQFKTDERQMEWLRARRIDTAYLTERFTRSKVVRRQFLPEKPGRRRSRLEEEGITLERLAELMNRYDAEVRMVDDAVGKLFDRLRELGLWERSIVIFTADHGQSLGENNWFGHGSITNLNTFVPLLVRFPSGLFPPQRLPQLVSLVDLMPTVLGRFELPGSELLRAQFEGEDVLSGEFRRPHVLVERTSDRVGDGERGGQFALLTERWKFVHRPEGQDALHDLAGAGEFVDVLASHADVAAELRETTLEILARRPALLEQTEEASREPDPELLQGLKDLGYVGEDE